MVEDAETAFMWFQKATEADPPILETVTARSDATAPRGVSKNVSQTQQLTVTSISNCDLNQ